MNKGRSPKSRAGRPTPEKLIQIEAAIMAAAWTLFTERGYSATAMESVAKLARVAKGTLYAKYPTKEALFAAALSKRLMAWSSVPEPEAGPRGNTLAERLVHHALNFLRKLENPEVAALSRLLQTEGHRVPELRRVVNENALAVGIKTISDEIETESRDSGKPVRDSQVVASMLLETCLGWARLRGASNDIAPKVRRQAVEARVRVLMEGRAQW